MLTPMSGSMANTGKINRARCLDSSRIIPMYRVIGPRFLDPALKLAASVVIELEKEPR